MNIIKFKPKRGMRLYVCSKLDKAALWRMFSHRGWPLISTWIYEKVGANSSPEIFNRLWLEKLIPEIRKATHIIVYLEEEDILKGGFLEAGYVAVVGKPLALVVPHLENNDNNKAIDDFLRDKLGSWVWLPWVHRCNTSEEAFEWLNSYKPSHPLEYGYRKQRKAA